MADPCSRNRSLDPCGTPSHTGLTHVHRPGSHGQPVRKTSEGFLSHAVSYLTCHTPGLLHGQHKDVLSIISQLIVFTAWKMNCIFAFSFYFIALLLYSKLHYKMHNRMHTVWVRAFKASNSLPPTQRTDSSQFKTSKHECFTQIKLIFFFLESEKY